MSGGGTVTSEKLTPQEAGAGAVELPDWFKELVPTLKDFYTSAISDRDFPYPIKEKDLKNATATMGNVMLQSVLKNVSQPYDLFKVDASGYLESGWQGLIDWGENYDAGIKGPSTDVTMRTKIPTPDRAAFSKYESDVRSRFTKLAAGKGEAMDVSEADFRQSLKEVEDRTAQAIEVGNRLAGSNAKLRKSNQMKIMLSRGRWEQDARDKELSRQADMELKSEFYGTEGLLELAKTAIGEETNYNQAMLAASQLELDKEKAGIGFGLQKDSLNIDAQRINEELKMKAKGVAAGALTGSQGLQESKISSLQTEEQRRLGNTSTFVNYLTDLWKYGKNYTLSAATGANQFLGTGADIYKTDISRYEGSSKTYDYTNPWASLLSGTISGAGEVLGGYLGS